MNLFAFIDIIKLKISNRCICVLTVMILDDPGGFLKILTRIFKDFD